MERLAGIRERKIDLLCIGGTSRQYVAWDFTNGVQGRKLGGVFQQGVAERWVTLALVGEVNTGRAATTNNLKICFMFISDGKE